MHGRRGDARGGAVARQDAARAWDDEIVHPVRAIPRLVAEDLAGHFMLEQGIRQQFLQPGVFDLEFLQPLGVRDIHATERAAPEVVAGFREPERPSEILHRHAGIDLAQESDTLCVREPFLHASDPSE